MGNPAASHLLKTNLAKTNKFIGVNELVLSLYRNSQEILYSDL